MIWAKWHKPSSLVENIKLKLQRPKQLHAYIHTYIHTFRKLFLVHEFLEVISESSFLCDTIGSAQKTKIAGSNNPEKKKFFKYISDEFIHTTVIHTVKMKKEVDSGFIGQLIGIFVLWHVSFCGLFNAKSSFLKNSHGTI